MRATREGNIPAPAGTLTRVVTRINGWDGITNAAAATAGTDIETDASLRDRYRSVLGRTARTSLSAIESALDDLDGVTAHRVVENNSSASAVVQGITIAANSIMAIVEGGADATIAHVIAGTKSIGVNTSGDQSASVPAQWGQSYTIRFQRVEDVPIDVTVQTVARPNFPSDGVQQLTTQMTQYVSGLGIGLGLGVNELYAPAYQVDNHAVTAITVTRRTGALGVATADLELDQKLTLDCRARVRSRCPSGTPRMSAPNSIC